MFIIKFLLLLLFTNQIYAGGQDLCEPQIIYKERIVYVKQYVDYPIEITKDVTKKNRLSLLVGNGPSNNVNTAVVPSLVTVQHTDENLIGLSYTRDIDNLVLGVFGLSNQTIGLSLGISY
jgi:hypothetical protein